MRSFFASTGCFLAVSAFSALAHADDLPSNQPGPIVCVAKDKTETELTAEKPCDGLAVIRVKNSYNFPYCPHTGDLNPLTVTRIGNGKLLYTCHNGPNLVRYLYVCDEKNAFMYGEAAPVSTTDAFNVIWCQDVKSKTRK